MKGFLSLKTAFSHAGSFVAVPLIPHLIGLGRDLTFPVLLFAFGIGTGISKRKKPAWPLIVLAIVYLFGSVVNEALIDQLVAHGHGSEHPLQGGFFDRLLDVATLTRLAHYADFLQPYLFFLGIALVADRIGKPMRLWNPWLIAVGALVIHAAGLLLSNTTYHGPMSMLWNGGYRTLQYAPLFAAGLLIGRYRKDLLYAKERTAWQSALLLIGKLVAIKGMVVLVTMLRPIFGHQESLWKDGDILALACGVCAGMLMLSAYDDLRALLHGKGMALFEKVGRRTIISLCVQTVVLPLAGFLAIQFSSAWVRGSIAMVAFAFVLAILLNWDFITARVTSFRTYRGVGEVDAEGATA